MGLERYDIKILLALVKAISGRKDFFRWPLDNGYPELAAFSNSVRGDREAMVWLFQHRFAWLAILSNAAGGEEKARVWIAKACHPANMMFALACGGEEKAIAWLRQHRLEIFIMMAHEVAVVQDTQAAEYAGPYVMHF